MWMVAGRQELQQVLVPAELGTVAGSKLQLLQSQQQIVQKHLMKNQECSDL